MQGVLDILQQHALGKEADTLEGFYASVKLRADGIGSGIVNDANAWALDTMHNPRYPLELLLRVISVRLETMNIVRALPGVVG